MLGTIVLLGCVTAAAIVGCILFVVLGPVPVNRRVTMVSRIQPIPLPAIAAPIMIEKPVAYTPPIAPFEPPSDLQFTPPPSPPRRARAVEAAFVAPRVVRRPRSEPAPMVRARAARGTEARIEEELHTIEVTAQEAAAFDGIEEHTVLDPAFS
jgi:hypothetical protein